MLSNNTIRNWNDERVDLKLQSITYIPVNVMFVPWVKREMTITEFHATKDTLYLGHFLKAAPWVLSDTSSNVLGYVHEKMFFRDLCFLKI